MKYKEYQAIKNLRPIARDELVIDCDNKNKQGELGIRRICMMMSEAGYQIHIYWYGGKSYHAHIFNIPHIAELPKEQNKKYKELLIQKYIKKARKYIAAPELDDIDLTSCIPDHLIAEPDKPHYRHKNIKKLIAVINEGYQNFCEQEIYKQATQEKVYKPNVEGSGITAKIIEKISIISLAEKFGLEVDSNGKAICPFHPDNNPSLKFYDEQGRFICFGCRTNGNIIKFYALIKKIERRFKK